MTDKKEMLSQKQSDTKAQTSAAAAAAAPAEVQMCVKCVQSIYIECTTCKTWLDYQKQHGNCKCLNVIVRPFVLERGIARVTQESKSINAKDQTCVKFVISNTCIQSPHIRVRRVSWEQWHLTQQEISDYHDSLAKADDTKQSQWTRDELEDLEEPVMNPEILHKALEATITGAAEPEAVLDPELVSLRSELHARKVLQHDQVLDDDYENEDQNLEINDMEDFEPDDGIFRGPSRREGAPAALDSDQRDDEENVPAENLAPENPAAENAWAEKNKEEEKDPMAMGKPSTNKPITTTDPTAVKSNG